MAVSFPITIAHLSSVHPARDVRILQKECSSLVQAGYQVTLVIPHDQSEVVNGVQILALPKPRQRFQRMTQTAWQVYRTALTLNADLYHLHDPELLPWGQLLRLSGKPVIYDMHENVPAALLTKPWLRPWLRSAVAALQQITERVWLTGLNVIFAETSYAPIYHWVKRSTIVLNMPLVDHLLALSASKQAHPTVSYIGGVSAIRGSSVTVEALSLLKQQGRTVHWECIGPATNTHLVELQARISAEGLNGIRFYGYLPATEGWPLIARCHIGLAILQPVPNYRESYPTKLFEYMALGLPVITSNFPLYQAIVEKEQCGLCVDPTSPAAVAQAIAWLFDHPAEAQAMGERGRQAVRERYNWQHEQHKLLEFYAESLTQR